MTDFQDLWRTRTDSITYLENAEERSISTLLLLFELMDLCIKQFEEHAALRNAEIYGLTLLKARNLSLGTLSLILDGLGQEAGALTRPLIEYGELLQYLRQHPAEIDSLYDGKELPSAGVRAAKIDGMFQEFREHLNRHASHSAYSSYSLSHLREPGSGKWKLSQRHVPEVLLQNIGDLAVQIYILLRQALYCLKEVDQSSFILIAERYDAAKPILFDVFKLDAGSDSS